MTANYELVYELLESLLYSKKERRDQGLQRMPSSAKQNKPTLRHVSTISECQQQNPANYLSTLCIMYLRERRRDSAAYHQALDSGTKGSGFELTAFSDADHAGCLDTRKSTSGGIQFLGDKLVSWMSKKQDCTAMSSAEG
ncbi:retrovirus-related pol polyprotein from transposon TNT 1-94 [Tanacetum coccineum]